MSPKNNRLNFNLEALDKAFFAPLEKLRLKYEERKIPKAVVVEVPKNDDPLPKAAAYHTLEELINAESALGRTIFGPIPVGHQREFFKDKNNIWIWHESWHERGKKKEITVRYEVRKDGVYKKLAGKSYRKIEGAELENFRKALHAYLKVLKKELY